MNLCVTGLFTTTHTITIIYFIVSLFKGRVYVYQLSYDMRGNFFCVTDYIVNTNLIGQLPILEIFLLFVFLCNPGKFEASPENFTI